MDKPKAERLQEFFRRLAKLPAAKSAKSARGQLATTLNQVEDEMTSIPNDPVGFQSDGRMYPPQDDSARAVPNRPDVKRFRSRSHNTFIRKNGALEVQELDGKVIFSKRGADGKGVWEP
jgi:hypothetical protein